MLKISIHGTKGGYHIFTDEQLTDLFDARPDTSRAAAIGEQAYSIHFSKQNCIFSKYKIIRDVIGDKRTGNIAFSIVISRNKKLSGNDIRQLLDQLANEYINRYIVDDNLDNKRENWDFVNDAIRNYESRIEVYYPDDLKNNEVALAEAAFLYYSTIDELENFLDSPYQDEYNEYKQVFFVNKELEGKPENPLNALRHNPASNLTGKIDLENPKYKLLFNESAKGGIKIEVYVNGGRRLNKDRIRRKDELEIKYSKLYFKTIQIKDKLFAISREYIEVNDVARTVSVKEVNLEPETKSIIFEIKDSSGKLISDAEITYKRNNQEERKVFGNEIRFSAEDIKMQWTITAKKGDLIAQPKNIIPENQNINVELVLIEHRKVQIYVTDSDNGNIITDYSINIEGENIDPKSHEITFIGNDLQKHWKISISHRDYYSDSLSFLPAVGNPISFKLKKKKPEDKKVYKINAGINGEKISGPDIVYSESELSNVQIKPKKGFRFTSFELNTSRIDNYDGTYVAKYKHKKSLLSEIFSDLRYITLGVIALITIIFVLIFEVFKHDESKIDHTLYITEYTEGIVLNLDTLNKFKNTHCESSAGEPKGTGSTWIQQLFGSNKKSKPNKTTIPTFCSDLSNAIKIRNAINEGMIDTLKILNYSQVQNSFKISIDKINDRFKDKTGITMKQYDPISEMNLDSVASFITNLQKLLQIREELKSLTVKVDLEKKKKDVTDINFLVDSIKNNIITEIDDRLEQLSQDDNPQRNKKIIDYLKGSDLQKSKLEEFKQQTHDQKLQTSIDLCLEFWKSYVSKNPRKSAFDRHLNKVKNDDILKDSKLKNFLELICKGDESFNKFKNLSGKGNYKTLTDLINKCNGL